MHERGADGEADDHDAAEAVLQAVRPHRRAHGHDPERVLLQAGRLQPKRDLQIRWEQGFHPPDGPQREEQDAKRVRCQAASPPPTATLRPTTRSNGCSIIVSHLPAGPTAFFKLSNFTPATGIAGHGSATGHTPEVILNHFTTRLGHRVGRMLGSLFPHVRACCLAWAPARRSLCPPHPPHRTPSSAAAKL